jgi:predicted nucleic acid-binding protein
LVAFANANDKYHKWAAQLATGVTEPLLTCEAVIAETAFHLESAAVALAMLNEGLVALAFDCREHLVQLARLADRFSGQAPDLADLCLVRMSELFPKHSVITIDRADFQVYRRNKREAIPLLCPPER